MYRELFDELDKRIGGIKEERYWEFEGWQIKLLVIGKT